MNEEINNIKKTLSTLISWIAVQSNSPITIKEASTLLNMLEGHNDLDK